MASSLLLVIFSAVVLVKAGVTHDSPETKIVNGHEIEIDQAPWQVLLQRFGTPKCGGSIISENWVLSAAHCTDTYNASDFTILVGTNSLKEGGTKYGVDKVVNHKEFSYDEEINDICLLKTAKRMQLIFPVKAVTLPAPTSKRPPVNTKLTVSGWGQTEDIFNPTIILRAVDVLLLDFKECPHGRNESTQICAGLESKNSCSGDSGGPLVQGNLLVGIVSYGHGTDMFCDKYPNIYSDVAAFRDWIAQNSGI